MKLKNNVPLHIELLIFPLTPMKYFITLNEFWPPLFGTASFKELLMLKIETYSILDFKKLIKLENVVYLYQCFYLNN